MADKKTSIWKKEISLRRKPRQAADVQAQAKPEKPAKKSAWKKEIRLRRDRPQAGYLAPELLAPPKDDKPSVWKKEISLGRKSKADRAEAKAVKRAKQAARKREISPRRKRKEVRAEAKAVKRAKQAARKQEISPRRKRKETRAEAKAAKRAEQAARKQEISPRRKRKEARAEAKAARPEKQSVWKKEIGLGRKSKVVRAEVVKAAKPEKQSVWKKEISFGRKSRKAAAEVADASALSLTPLEPAVLEPAPAPVAFEPEPIAFEPEPVLEPVAFEPEPVAFEPEPAAFEPEPTAFDPEPVAFEPKPVAFELDAVEPEPVTFELDEVQPEPAQAQSEQPVLPAEPVAEEDTFVLGPGALDEAVPTFDLPAADAGLEGVPAPELEGEREYEVDELPVLEPESDPEPWPTTPAASTGAFGQLPKPPPAAPRSPRVASEASGPFALPSEEPVSVEAEAEAETEIEAHESKEADTTKVKKQRLSRAERKVRRAAEKKARRRNHKAKKLVGLKIGASQLAAARVSNNGSVEVLQIAREPLESGVVVAGELRDPDALASALKAFFKKNKLPRRGIRLGLSNNRIGVRMFDLIGIDEIEQLENAVRFRVQETLPIPIEEAVLDYHVVDESVDEEGNLKRRIVLVVAYRDLIDRYVAACRKAGLRLVGIDLEAFALLRALGKAPSELDADQQEERVGLVVVSVGHDRSTFAVSDGRVCEFTRVLDWGGYSLNIAIARALDLTPVEAEPIKLALSLTDNGVVPDGITTEQADAAREAVVRAVEGFARDLVSSLRFYQSQPESLGIREIVLTGGTAELPGFAAELERLIGVYVRVGDPLARVKVARRVKQRDRIGSLAAAIGLGIED